MKHALNNLLLRMDNILSYEYVFQLPKEISKPVYAINGKISDLVNAALYELSYVAKDKLLLYLELTDDTQGNKIAFNKLLIHTIITKGDLSKSDNEDVLSMQGTMIQTKISNAVSKLIFDLKQHINAMLPSLLDPKDGNRNSTIIKELKGHLCSRLWIVAGGREEHFYPLVDSLFDAYEKP
jgi:hypothetical protein